MDYDIRLLCLSGIILIYTITFSGASTTSTPELDVNPPNSPLTSATPKMPAWIRCLQVESVENSTITQDNSITLVSLHWCSNAESILTCLEDDLVKLNAPNNPLDFFVNLNYKPMDMRQKSNKLCEYKIPENQGKLACAANVTNVDVLGCSIRFKQSVDYMFLLKNRSDITETVLQDMACDVTSETTRCMAQVLQHCDAATSRFLMGYYGLFTNSSCVYNTSIPWQPESTKTTPPESTILLKCGTEATEILNGRNSPSTAFNISQAVIVTILKQDCRLYRQRYECYEREFPQATAFLDVWQKQTFDLQRALSANQQFCANIDEFATRLDPVCFNNLDYEFQICEGNYGKVINAASTEWSEHGDNFELQRQACNASLERVACLKQAFTYCGDYVAQKYYRAQVDMLPDVCFTHPVPPTTPKTTPTTSSTTTPKTTPRSTRSNIANSPTTTMLVVKSRPTLLATSVPAIVPSSTTHHENSSPQHFVSLTLYLLYMMRYFYSL